MQSRGAFFRCGGDGRTGSSAPTWCGAKQKKPSPGGEGFLLPALGGQDAAHVDNGMARTFHGALAAAQAEALVDLGEVLFHGDRAGRTGFRAESAGNTFCGCFCSNGQTLTHTPQPTQPYWQSAVARQPPEQATTAYLGDGFLSLAMVHAFLSYGVSASGSLVRRSPSSRK